MRIHARRRPISLRNHLIHSARALIAAHRGARVRAPENTLPAFQLAVESGADMIELDVQRTADGELVVLHDSTLDRTTGAPGTVADTVLADLKRLDAGSHFGPDFTGTPVPTLAEVLAILPEHVAVNTDIKTYNSDPSIGTQVLEAVHDLGVSDRTIISSTDPRVLRRVRQADGSILTGLITSRMGPESIKIVRRVGADLIHPHHSCAPRLSASALPGRLPAAVWTVNDPETVRRLDRQGVAVIISDRPRMAREALDGSA